MKLSEWAKKMGICNLVWRMYKKGYREAMRLHEQWLCLRKRKGRLNDLKIIWIQRG
jgi:hypothetical protein